MRGVDLTGQIFSRLKVISYQGKDKHSHNLWLCVCECGNQGTYTTSVLTTENTMSCGCFRKETCAAIGKTNQTHGLTNAPGYKSWSHIVDRCTDPKHEHYHNYGGRGIKLHDEWLESPEKFLTHIGPRPSAEHTVDRIENEGHYEPGNVRWATPAEQSRNTRRNIHVEYLGETYILKDLANAVGVSFHALKKRLDGGKLSVEDAVYETEKAKQHYDEAVKRREVLAEAGIGR